MDVLLENEYLRVGVKSAGAELFDVRHKMHDLQYMWRADPAVWGKTSPVLFPVVGTLKEDTFIYLGSSYKLPRHGFARDTEFEVSSGKDKAIFGIQSTAATLQKYPFTFRLQLIYSLDKNTLSVSYRVENTGNTDMYFSVGGHPAFAVPLVDGTTYEDYFLLFDKVEKTPRWPINAGGLIETTPMPFLEHTNTLPLRKDLFLHDAIVLKYLKSKKISIRSAKHRHGLDFHFDEFPFLGIWAAKNGDFVCIEPWCGIADSTDHERDLVSKEGIEKIAAQQSWSRTWKVDFY